MPITVDSPLMGVGGSIAEARAGLVGLSQVENDYINEMWRLCEATGLDFRIMFAQMAHETAGGTSRWWTERHNPAGLGVTGDPAQNEASPYFADGKDAARAQVAHMLAYVGDGIQTRDGDNGDHLGLSQPITRYDPRWSAVGDAGFWGSVDTLGDLGNGKWAVDPDYARLIAATANTIFTQEEPVSADARPPGTIGCWWPHDGRAIQEPDR